MSSRIKNPYFWIGIGGAVLAGMGVSPEMLTSWSAVGEAFVGLITNPYMLASVGLSLLGIFVDPTTKGLGDGK